MTSQRVLLLNAYEQPVAVISWQKAVVLLFRDKASVPFDYDHGYEIPTSQGSYKVPSAIVLRTYQFNPQRKMPVTRKNVFKRDKWLCQYCCKKLDLSSATVDHVTPVSKGGKNTWANLVTSCKPCNAKKANKTLEQAKLKLRKTPEEPKMGNVLFGHHEHEPLTHWSRWIAI